MHEEILPVIISASRSTDVPAFYAEWFFRRLREGWCGWRNPFNGAIYRVGFEKTRFVVFWSKNPKPLLDYVDELRERRIECYVQFTLNDYVAEGLDRKTCLQFCGHRRLREGSAESARQRCERH